MHDLEKDLSFYRDKGREYAANSENAPYNAYYERPAMYGLIGDVKALKVLDVGCGNGIYAEWLLESGAGKVVALDASETMVNLFRERLGDQIPVHLASIGEPLSFVPDEYFDLAVCPLVLHYLEDWDPPFRHIYEKLKPGGRLVFSTGHPLGELSASESGNYFEIERVEEYWSNYDYHVANYRRPLGAIIDSFQGAGFVLERLVEPQPVPEFKEKHPGAYENLLKRPHFICFSVRRP